MAYHLACYFAKIAAIAPVAGLMGNYTYNIVSPISSFMAYDANYYTLEDNGETTNVLARLQYF